MENCIMWNYLQQMFLGWQYEVGWDGWDMRHPFWKQEASQRYVDLDGRTHEAVLKEVRCLDLTGVIHSPLADHVNIEVNLDFK